MSVVLDLAQIVLIDLSLAGDNALVIGMAVTALPKDMRKRAMMIGILAATVLRIAMAFFAVQLMHIAGLPLAGGLLLLWVGWKLERELRHRRKRPDITLPPEKKIHMVIGQIVIADISMSLDNVLGVVGIARDHMEELAVGLMLSIALMGLASSQIARLTARYPKLGYIGIVIILITAVRMIYDGVQVFLPPIHGYA